MPIPGEVNVFFHGVFFFHVTADKIRALIPRVQGHGAPVAGPFARQLPFLPATNPQPCVLEGVTPGDAKEVLDPDRNLLFLGKIVVREDPSLVHGHVELPRPLETALPFRQLEARLTVTEGGKPVPAGDKFSSLRPNSVQLFRYSAPDLAKVSLTGNGVSVRSDIYQIEGRNFVNLHVSNDDAVDPGGVHRGLGFQALVSLVEGFENLRLGPDPKVFSYAPAVSSSAKGYSSSELASSLETSDAVYRSIGGTRYILDQAETGSQTQDCFNGGRDGG